MTKQILIVEDDIAFGKMITSFLERKGYQVKTCTNGKSARVQLERQVYDLLITDLQLPDDNGLELLAYRKLVSSSTEVIVMTGYAEVTTAVEAIKKGALDYISKPFRPDELIMVIEQALLQPNKMAIDASNSEVKKTSAQRVGFVEGISEKSKKVNDHLKLVGPTNMSVLIHGENGTGKEVAAKAIHNFSTRKKESFVAVDCGAIPKELASSEFFGHLKGSFTGAISDKKGHFEVAQNGTLFLDEVGNLSYENQIHLLRALQERKIKPVGGTKEIALDIRIITATNENLNEAVAQGTFREDLYHRLNEFSVHIPALRERREDLFLFSEYFLEEANQSLQKNVLGMSDQVEMAFLKYGWPGNLRELKNVIMRSVLLTTGDYIQLEAIPKEVLSFSEEKVTANFNTTSHEKQLILNALKEANNNKSLAAKLLNISRKTLYNKLERYQLEG